MLRPFFLFIYVWCRLVGEAICKSLGSSGWWKTIWSCENVQCKQQWIRCVAEPDSCLFTDICGLSDHPYCTVHQGHGCEAQPSHIAIAGWSCKSLSKLNLAYQKGNFVNALRTQSGSSGETFSGLCSYLRKNQPPIYLGENVEEMCDVLSDNRIAYEEVHCYNILATTAIP